MPFSKGFGALMLKKKKRFSADLPESDEAAEVAEQVESEQRVKVFDASAIDKQIARMMDLTTFEPKSKFWLDTGSELCNRVLGSPTRGITKMLELAGEEHAGKTLVASLLAGMAQKQGAGIGRLDIEDSKDPDWEAKWGLDARGVVTRSPKLVKFGAKDEDVRLQSAEELFREAELGMSLLAKHGFKKQFWFVDSIATLQTEMQGEASNSKKGSNMRTRNDRAMFLSETLPRWAGLAAAYGAVILFINQLREKPGVAFGDPIYSPGGRSIKHANSVRARIRRCGNGRIKKGDRTIGLVSIISNIKNKVGGGSVQGAECGVAFRWNRNPGTVEFMEKAEADAMMKKKKNYV